VNSALPVAADAAIATDALVIAQPPQAGIPVAAAPNIYSSVQPKGLPWRSSGSTSRRLLFFFLLGPAGLSSAAG
jgi:hypothetical protein